MNYAFNLTLIGYFAALLLAAANLFTKEKRRLAAAATLVLTAGAVAQTVYLILRWIAAGRAPFSNMFESLVLFAWAVVVVYLALQIRHKIPVLGMATALLAVLTLAYASTFETKIEPLMPALRSNWLTLHVFSCFLGYGAVALAFLSSLAYLAAARNGSTIRPETAQVFELVTEKTISFGFLFLTV